MFPYPVFLQNLSLVQGGNFAYVYPSYTTADGTPIDISEWSASLAVWLDDVQTQPLLSLSSEATSLGSIGLSTSGNVTVTVTAAGSISLPSRPPSASYRYGLVLTPPSGGAPVAFASGRFTVKTMPGVVPPPVTYNIVGSGASPFQMPSVAAQTVEFQSSGSRVVANTPPSPIVGWRFRAVWSKDTSNPPSPGPELGATGTNITSLQDPTQSGPQTYILQLGAFGTWEFNGTLWVQVA